jgi:hypothetical protein
MAPIVQERERPARSNSALLSTNAMPTNLEGEEGRIVPRQVAVAVPTNQRRRRKESTSSSTSYGAN